MLVGKRKRAIARGTWEKGSGRIFLNGKPLETVLPELYQLRVREAMLLLPQLAEKIDVHIRVEGGGIAGWADAARIVVAKALVEAAGREKEKVEHILESYDRTLLVADVRLKEKRKPNTHGKARAKRQKSYR